MTEATVAARPQVLPRMGGGLLLLAGAGLLGLALLADLLRGGGGIGAFGLAQSMAAIFGLAIATAGLDISRGRASDWLASAVRARSEALPLLVVFAQLVLIVFLAGWFQIENPAFARLVLPYTAFGFVLHHLMPARHRLTYFAIFSLLGFVLVLGWITAAWIVALTLVFVALCHLPGSWMGRVAALLVAGVALGVLRVMPGAVPFSSAVWPILGSILMFRLIVYAYDVRNSKEPVPAKWSVAYFFLLPNVVFPLFPVVDFATFRRTYYDREPADIYQRGIDWMARGVIHLLIYRAVYQHLTIPPSEVTSGADLVRYMSATFLLYLRVSGTFHLIVGMMHLFGFRMPETHRFFYLASSFTDFWRRINIYWKDFMMKLVFYPTYFPLRKRGETTALVVGTLAVFFVTWLTHSYQWFWILGKWLISWTDGLFWAILGVFLVANSLWEAKHGRKRTLPGATRKRFREGASVALKATFVFVTICTLWSMWGSPTLGDWFDLMSVQRFNLVDLGAVAGLLALVAIAAFIGEVTGRSQGDADRGAAKERNTWKAGALRTMPQLACLAFATTPMVLGTLNNETRQFARDLRVPELNKSDADALQRGYYENLQGVSLQNSQLWELYAQRPAQTSDIWKSGILQERDDFLARDMKPFFATFDRGKSIRTNRWGMRDRDYEKQKPAGVYRVALLGQSYVAGDGVSDGETFEAVTEDRLASAGEGSKRVEILNFAVGSYSVIQQLILLDDRVWDFSPDLLVLVGHPIDAERLALHVVKELRDGVEPPFPWVRDLLARARVTRDLRETEALSRLAPYREELLSWTQRQIVEKARARGIRAIWVYLTMPEKAPAHDVVQRLSAQAREAGFEVLDWSDVYDGVDLGTLQASAFDFHPNVAGHQRIADRFYRDLQSQMQSATVRQAGSASPASSPTTEEKRK